MAEEKITERDDGVTTERTIERSDDADKTVIIERRGGGAGWVIAIILLVAVIGGAYFLSQSGAREAVETEAITEAAENVGDAAQQVG
ncbi:MAG: hypothetical protein ACTS1X_08700, partial [Parasphingopyxis sp.]|uniref:hypothetical protein n=1 Tax=Parasphingopyxis sp. TaxID=1920299 RepID=UPI003F9F020F